MLGYYNYSVLTKKVVNCETVWQSNIKWGYLNETVQEKYLDEATRVSRKARDYCPTGNSIKGFHHPLILLVNINWTI